MDRFKDKKIAVLGFGIEGESTTRFLLKKGSKISVFDVRREEQFERDKLNEFRERSVNFQFDSYPDNFSSFDLIIRSPGISPLSAIIEKVKKQGVKITSPTQIFFDLCPSRIIGVTGTKGKGTTSSLIYEMLKKQGLDTYLGGNIGTPPLDFLDDLRDDSWAVLELSSFQLQDLDKSPRIAVVLMVTSEHLDYHRDLKEYVEAKRNILRFQTHQDFAVINRDYPASNESDTHTEGQVYFVSREQDVERGCYIRDGFVWIKTEKASGPGVPPARRVIPTQDILLPGKHNFENVCAASMAAFLAGVETPKIAAVLKEFKGLEHRLELVRIFNGVAYYDDSFSTTPETAIAAIEAFDEPKILILGGSSKKSDFTELGRVIRDSNSIKAIIGIGEEWPQIKLKIKNEKLKMIKVIERCKDMYEIVQRAREIAEIGDVVVLTPACASFGMFKNYKDRGNQFKDQVLKL